MSPLLYTISVAFASSVEIIESFMRRMVFAREIVKCSLESLISFYHEGAVERTALR